MKRRKGFTLIELMVVILIVSILAGVAIPLMQGRIDSAKWSEANAAAGTIRTAVRAYHAEKGATASAALATATLDDSDTQAALGFNDSDLAGTYFDASNYTITSVDSDGIAVITVSAGTGLEGTYVLGTDGAWTKQAEE
ncbi:MAG: type II secretion system protein [Sedimentisphaerales bacterium]|nr:type II secretion system protein [Sedimentisphaerales bacterium]